MVFTYDVATSIGKVRLLIPDREAANPVFQDAELTELVTLEGTVRRAAALGLETIASDTAATLRVTRTLGLEVDGAKASDALLKRAAVLRTQDADAEARVDGLFDWAEWVSPGDVFAARERIDAEVLRSLP